MQVDVYGKKSGDFYGTYYSVVKIIENDKYISLYDKDDKLIYSYHRDLMKFEVIE